MVPGNFWVLAAVVVSPDVVCLTIDVAGNARWVAEVVRRAAVVFEDDGNWLDGVDVKCDVVVKVVRGDVETATEVERWNTATVDVTEKNALAEC